MDFDHWDREEMDDWRAEMEAEAAAELRAEAEMDEAADREAWDEQQADPLRAVCEWPPPPWDDCVRPTVYDREDEIPF